jgi:hypothetical protein
MPLFSTIALATRGRIIPNGYKRTLALASLGWILVSSGPPPPPIPIELSTSGGGGGIGIVDGSPLYRQEMARVKRLIQDDDELLAMIKIFVKCR